MRPGRRHWKTKSDFRQRSNKSTACFLKNTKKEKSLLSQVEDLNVKISVRSDLVKVNNQQANLLTQQINVNQRNITDLRKELQSLKKDYAEMIQKSYKSKSSQNRLMFLFSSEDFLQAYKRVQYMKQYAKAQEKTRRRSKKKPKPYNPSTRSFWSKRPKKMLW